MSASEREQLSSAYDMAIEASTGGRGAPAEEVYYGFGVFMGISVKKLKALREEMQKRNNSSRFETYHGDGAEGTHDNEETEDDEEMYETDVPKKTTPKKPVERRTSERRAAKKDAARPVMNARDGNMGLLASAVAAPSSMPSYGTPTSAKQAPKALHMPGPYSMATHAPSAAPSLTKPPEKSHFTMEHLTSSQLPAQNAPAQPMYPPQQQQHPMHAPQPYPPSAYPPPHSMHAPPQHQPSHLPYQQAPHQQHVQYMPPPQQQPQYSYHPQSYQQPPPQPVYGQMPSAPAVHDRQPPQMQHMPPHHQGYGAPAAPPMHSQPQYAPPPQSYGQHPPHPQHSQAPSYAPPPVGAPAHDQHQGYASPPPQGSGGGLGRLLPPPPSQAIPSLGGFGSKPLPSLGFPPAQYAPPPQAPQGYYSQPPQQPQYAPQYQPAPAPYHDQQHAPQYHSQPPPLYAQPAASNPPGALPLIYVALLVRYVRVTMTYAGPFETPPVRIGREVRHTTGRRPATARSPALQWLAPQRPFSAGCHIPPATARAPRRPVTARPETMEDRIAHSLMPDSATAIAEAALRETYQVQDIDPLCGPTVEIRPLQAVLPRGTRNADFFRARGYQHRMQGDFTQAIEDYQSALKMAPRDFKTLFSLGIACERVGKVHDALAAYTKACAVAPRDPYVHYNMGICYTLTEDFPRAVASFTLAIELDAKNVDFYRGRAHAHRKAGQYTDAAKDYSSIGFLTSKHVVDAGGSNQVEQVDAAMSLALTRAIARLPPLLRSEADLQVLEDKMSAFPVCRQLPPALQRKLCQQLVAVHVAPKTVLYNEGDRGHFVFFVLHGKVDVYKAPMVKVGDARPPALVLERHEGSVEMQLSRFEAAELYRESAFIDNVKRLGDAAAAPLYTLHTGSEFGHQGRFRQLVRAVNAVAAEACDLLLLPWAVLEDLEAEHAESEAANVAAFLGKLSVFRYVAPAQLRVLALKARWIKVPSATVVQSPGQHHEGLLIVRCGSCQLRAADAVAPGGGVRAAAKGKRAEQHARQAYLQIEHEDDPAHFVFANHAQSAAALTTRVSTAAVIAELRARDFVGERSFLSNEGNEKSFAKQALVSTTYAELLYVRKADFFTETSYATRQRVRANIQKYTEEAGTRPTPHEAHEWASYKAKLVEQVIQDRRRR
ncbi:hypothetical protein ACHHYP_05202 [Achlya hypogyna]|uniref:Cyclic nucleotide-binding domain-containing protein n=1 Tax=Achlya hypogyna TaxID=1202772 RepID=A0A1V9YZ62_ACHHY|nr:hypothetical protein ACHHYP_05202 [Achlya hypogyna]